MSGFESIFRTPANKRVTLQYNAGGNERMLIRIDATRAEEYTLSAQATGHEVEDGSEISDHVIRKGRRLVIEGIVSDTPINLAQAAAGGAAGVAGGAAGGAVGTVATVGAIALSDRLFNDTASKPSKTAFDIFNAIYEAGPPLTIITGLTTYPNMIMENLTVPRNARNAHALEFKAVFKEVRIVTARTVGVSIPPEAREKSVRELSAAETKLGKQQSTTPDASRREKGASWLWRIKERF